MMTSRWRWILVGCMIIGGLGLQAQAPLGINYQGVARAADGSPLTNRNIGLRISITNGPGGSVEYEEEQHPETNAFGLFAVVIGQGQSAGSLADVDWSTGNKWLQVELDPDDNGRYTLVGSQQLMSVPYALYARNAGNGLEAGFGININNGQINNTLPDQIINLTGAGATTVSGTYPNFTITSADEVNDADADPANEIQDLQLSGNSLTITNNPAATPVDLSGYLDNTDNQNLSLSQSGTSRTIGISGGSGITLDVADNDNDPANELQTISKTGSTVTLSNGGGSFTDAVDDADNDPANEIQNLSSTASGVNRTINISGGAGTTISVADNDNDPANEYNTGGAFVSNNTIRITDSGGNVDIPLGPLNVPLDAGNQNITNLADPVNAQDAVNLQYLEQVDAADYAISVPINYLSPGAGDVALDLSGFSLDKGGLISGSTITISESGVYAVSVQGASSSATGSDIDIEINGSPTPVIKAYNHYMGLYLFELLPGDQIQFIVRFNAAETVTLQISVYKI